MGEASIKVLIVDDAESTRETIKDVLIEKGYEVLTADGGGEALRILSMSDCDIVLLDLVMPEMDGIEVLGKIKAKHKRTEVIIITEYADVDAVIKAINSGAFACIQKPISFRLLEHYLEEIAAKRKLIESEEKYRTLFESLPDAILLMTDTIIDCNAETCRFFGYEREDIIGHSFLEFAPPTQSDEKLSKEVAWERIDAAFSGIPQYFEWRIMRKDGVLIETEISLKALTLGGKQVLQAVLRDITRRKQVENALKHRAEFERLIALASRHIISLPPDELDIGINYVLEQIGEFSGVDRSYLFIFSEDMRAANNTHEWCSEGIEPQIERLQGIPLEDYTWWMDRLNRDEVIYIPSVDDLPPDAGSEKAILQSQSIKSLIVVPLVYGKSLIGFLGFDSVRRAKIWETEDITLLNIVGETIVNALKRKEAADALKQQTRNAQFYLDLMVHDITNFNQVILGYIDLLNTVDELDAKKRRQYVNIIRSELGKIISLIDNVKILSRLEEERGKLSSINLVEVIKNVIEGIRIDDWTGDKRVDIKFELSDDRVAYHCMADDLVNSIFTNLIDNAIKHAPSKDVKIHIELEKGDGIIRTYITDWGVGIPDQQKKEIFQRYMRVDEGIQGSGIGLSLVCELVRSYNGKVWVEDRIEGDYTQGAKFVVELPAAEGAEE